MVQEANRHGYLPTVAPAAQSSKSEIGSHGGCVAMVKSGLRSSPLSDRAGANGEFVYSASLVGRKPNKRLHYMGRCH